MTKMKVILLGIFFLVIIGSVYSQTDKVYDPDADAKKDIEEAIKKATKNGKHVFLQIGGNWCPWCKQRLI